MGAFDFLSKTNNFERLLLVLLFISYGAWFVVFKYVTNYGLMCFKKCQEACPVSIFEFKVTVADTILPFTVQPNITGAEEYIIKNGTGVTTPYDVIVGDD